MNFKSYLKLTSTLFILGSATISVIASLSSVNAQNQPKAPENRVSSPEIKRKVLPNIVPHIPTINPNNTPHIPTIVPNTNPLPNMREVSPILISPGGKIKGEIIPTAEDPNSKPLPPGE